MKYAAIIIFGVFALSGCEEDKPRCVATMEGKVFFDCDQSDLQFDSTFQDSISKLSFEIPEKWQLTENQKVNSSWVLFDTSRVFNQGSAMAIIFKKSDLTLKEYFYKEIDHADVDSSLAVIRAGRDQLGNQFCYWFQMERHQENMPPQHSIMYYVEGEGQSKVVLDALIYGTDQMDERFCRLKQIANTIRFN